jgi:MOSC domain-containing protein
MSTGTVTTTVGRVGGLWRYPIKSLDGEQLDALTFDRRGVERDREWALVDAEGGIASGKRTRRFRKVPGLLRHAGRLNGGVPVIALEDGRTAPVDSEEAARLVEEIAGSGWSLRREQAVPHFDAGAVHLVTSATLATINAAARWPVSVERLRPNVLIELDGEGFPEDAWLERTLELGSARLRVTKRVVRCVMLNHRRPGLRARRDVLKLVGKLNHACAGVYADVIEPGEVRVGDPVMLGRT